MHPSLAAHTTSRLPPKLRSTASCQTVPGVSGCRCVAGARVKEVTSSDTESPPEVTLEDGSKMTAKRGIVVATDQPSAAKLLGQHLDSSPSKEGKGRGTCNLYFK